MGLHSEREHLLQTGALAAELRYTETIYFEQIPKPLRRMFLCMKREIAILIDEFGRKMINHLYILITKSHS